MIIFNCYPGKTRAGRRLVALVLLLTAGFGGVAAELAFDAATAWTQVEAASSIVPLAPALRGRLPSKEELTSFRKTQSQAALKAADLAREFTRKFPNHPNANTARQNCHKWLEFAIRRGAHERAKDIRQLENEMMFQPGMTADQRFALRRAAIDRETAIAQAQGKDMMEVFEKGVRNLQKEFPQRTETYQMLYAVALRSPAKKAEQLVGEILKSNATAELKASARSILVKSQRIGKPLRIKFTAIDGREIDTSKMKGKVILIDFWASWSAPSMSQLARLEKLHQTHHAKGLEILGISFDHEKRALTSFVNHRRIPWAQHYDRGTRVKSLREILGVKEIPALWIIDKRGKLRDINARQNLIPLVEKLLAEPTE